MLNKNGHDFEIHQLQKKWQNIQQRIKDKQKTGKQTGGGPPVGLSTNDELAVKIIGECNPKLVMIPAALENGRKLQNDDEEEESKIPVSTKKLKQKSAKKRELPSDGQQIDELHREVLLLQKEKLILQIERLKELKGRNRSDKSTQADVGCCETFLEQLECNYHLS